MKISKLQEFLNMPLIVLRYLLYSSVVVFLAIPFVAFGMEFYWGSAPPGFGQKQSGTKDFLYLTGDIRPGEYERFRTFMLSNLNAYIKSPRLVVLSSNGGDLVETLRIAKLLKDMYASVHVINEKCASACFFLYLSGTFRHARPGLLGIHRAYFDSYYFAGLSPSQAQKRQSELTSAIKSVLDENGVPQFLIERMNGTSSTEMYWLTGDDLVKISMRPAWYEELLIAKCAFDKPLEETFKATPSNAVQYDSIKTAYTSNSKSVALCEWELVKPELAKLHTRLHFDGPQNKSSR